jgi:hypothetical protein
VPDIRPDILDAAEEAIIRAASDFSRDDIKERSSRKLARAALTAAAPLLAEAKDLSAAASLHVLMSTPGVMDTYNGWMHGYHGNPAEGCECCGHDSDSYRAGFKLGEADPDKPAADEAKRRWQEWKPREEVPDA